MHIFKVLLTILFIIATVGIVTTKPSIHKPAIVEEADFTLASLETPKVITVKSDFPEPPVSEKALKTVNVQNVETVKPKTETVKTVPSKPVQSVKTVVKVIPSTPVVKEEIQKPKPQPQPKLPDVVDRVAKNLDAQKPEPPKVQEKPVEVKKEEPVKTVTQPVNTTPLTEKEEIIAWNKWRSDLQNKVMRDSRINAPVGTTFHFSCTVDKFGNISNINTWSDNDYYTPLAKRVIKPVLSSYQNQSILKFPDRTRRTITNVTGSFTMAYTDRYSTPADYSDYERIR